MWVEPVSLSDHDSGRIVLTAPNDFSVRRLKENYQSVFETEFSRLGQKIRIEFKVQNKKTETAKQLTGKKKAQKKRKTNRTEKPAAGFFPARAAVRAPKEQPMLPGMGPTFNSGRMLKKSFTFDDFVVGDNSNFAYSASLSLAQGRINGSGMLFLLSKTGLGKSHLSQAVGHHIIANSDANRVYYVTAEDFTNEMVSALKDNTINMFKEKYRKKCDVLILEDVHFLSGKDATQKELAATFDYLLDGDKKIIFSGGMGPGEIPKLNDRLRSRLCTGLITPIGAPDFTTRRGILKQKAKGLGVEIPGQVLDCIADGVRHDVRLLTQVLGDHEPGGVESPAAVLVHRAHDQLRAVDIVN